MFFSKLIRIGASMRKFKPRINGCISESSMITGAVQVSVSRFNFSSVKPRGFNMLLPGPVSVRLGSHGVEGRCN